MKYRESLGLFFLSLSTLDVLAQSIPAVPQITSMPSLTESTSSPQIPSTSTSFSSTTTVYHAWDGILSSADYVLDEVNEHLHIDLRKRQGGIAATNAPQATSVVTQMSPVTTYGADRGWPQVVYTQLFVAVPDQWPSAQAGTIGLGTIQGEIGVVKTKSKRYAGPEPTGQVFRIKGREVVVSG